MNIPLTIENLRKMRKSKKISQEVMAAALGISSRSYQRKEEGKQKVSLEDVLKIAEVLQAKATIEFKKSEFLTLDY